MIAAKTGGGGSLCRIAVVVSCCVRRSHLTVC